MKLLNRPLFSEMPRVEILPLIDIVFLVLIAFIYASLFMTHKTGLPVKLPGAAEAETARTEVITLTIMQDGEFYLDDTLVPFERLEEMLSSAKTMHPYRNLYVMADRDARLDSLVKAMDIAHKLGMDGLTIATDKQVTIAQKAGD